MSRTYEGRPLPRPGEELVDQGLAFDLGTVLSRRQVLRLLGAGVVAAGVAACSGDEPPRAAGTGEIPEEAAGPFPADGTGGPDVLSEDGVVRSDIRSSFAGATGTADGVPLVLELEVRDLAAGAPMAGAAVYVWQCDREARYSLYDEGVTAQNYLRGVQVAGADGTVRFTSVFPGCYPGRWPHVHLEVFPDRASLARPEAVVATSQLALPTDACEAVYATSGYRASVPALSRVSLDSDGVFGDDGGARQLATVTGDPAAGFTARLVVGVDPRTPPGLR